MYNNFCRAIFDAFNRAIPDAFKISNTLGPQGWDHDLTIREILGIPTAHDVWENDQVVQAAYNPSDPIEGLLKRVEDCKMMAVAASNPYTLPQLISTVIVLVDKSGNYVEEMKELHEKPPIEKENWFILQKFLITTYLDTVRHGLITAGAQGYHGAAYNLQCNGIQQPRTHH